MRTQIDLLKEYGVRVRGRQGQHLLIDPNVQRKIVDLLEPRKGERFLEIGPGLGALTGEMLGRGALVTAIEKDAAFVEILKEVFHQDIVDGRLSLIHGDALEEDIRGLLRKKEHQNVRKVISNLPYYITGPLLFRLFSLGELIEEAVLMMQLEVARRILAEPGGKDYGRLTLAARLYTEARHAFDVSPRCFTPEPEVRSAVLRFHFHTKLRDLGLDEREILDLIRIAFSQRRKRLFSVLSRHPEFNRSREEWETVFERCGISREARAEELMVKDFIALTQSL